MLLPSERSRTCVNINSSSLTDQVSFTTLLFSTCRAVIYLVHSSSLVRVFMSDSLRRTCREDDQRGELDTEAHGIIRLVFRKEEFLKKKKKENTLTFFGRGSSLVIVKSRSEK